MNFRNIILAAVFLSIAAIADGQPKDWANFGRYRQQNEEIAGQKINAVFMGNSITDNWARMDPGFFSDHGFVGRGISGQTTSEMLVRFRRDVLDLKPEAVAILAGINDIAQNNGEISLENTFGTDTSRCLWRLFLNGNACRRNYPALRIPDWSYYRTDIVRNRCLTIYSRRANHVFPFFPIFSIRNRMRTDLSGNCRQSLCYRTWRKRIGRTAH